MAWMIQGAQACVIAAVLFRLWIRERPRRSALQFAADNSKSIILALMTHFLVILITALIGDVTDPHCYSMNYSAPYSTLDIDPGAQPCDWYMITFLLDDFIGVPITILLYTGSAGMLTRCSMLESLSRIGDYEARPNAAGQREPSTNRQRVGRWLAQVAHWLLCALIARLLETSIVLMPLLHQLMLAANALGWWACSKEAVQAKQWIHLMLMPLLLDAGQFAIQNFVLRARRR